MELIDKAAIVTEIERRIKERDFQMKSGCWVSSTYMYEDLLDFLDTLEVKDVDLEKEYEEYVVDDPVLNKLVNRYAGICIARHFFELGLNAKEDKQ